jgi:alpha-galactosidase
MAGPSPKIAMIGAGSVVFAKRLLIDLLSWSALQESEIALMDIDQGRLDLIHALATRLVQQERLPARVTATTDRRVALDGADYVVCSIQVGGLEMYEPDVEIPRRYGIDQTVGDTLGPGGVFRGLRTIPVLASIGRDMEALCPHALLINYSNPMNINMWGFSATTRVRAIGLCHSVQGTAGQLARYLGVPPDELSYWCAGINHQAWYLELRRGHGGARGEDLYPLLRQKMDDPEVYARDRVRFEVMRHFGYFVTESSRHMSEYVPWFRRTADDRERFTPPTGRPEGAARYEAVWESIKRQIAGEAPLELTRSREYCSYIVNAVETNAPFRFNGNVPNTGLITNLPPDCSVEVPILVDNAGLHPCYVGDLPAQLAAINRTNVNVQELAVKSFLERDKDAAFQACALDPLAAATVGLDNLKQMTAELFEANARWLEGYESRLPAARPPAPEPAGAAGR